MNDDVDLPAFNVLSLCAGVGALDIGISIAEPRARTIAYVEREAYAAAVLAARMETQDLDDAPIWSDVASFDARAWRGLVDCVVSGDPCQPNSTAGKRRGADDERWLAGHVVRIFDESGANRLFRENVAGNLAGQLEFFISALERLGCRVACGIFSAAEVGGAHRRERLFIMADRSGGGLHGVDGRRAIFQPANRNKPMADGDGWRCQGGGQPQPAWFNGKSGNESDGCRGAAPAPLFAPGPNDSRWPEFIAAAPGLEPALCRMADGMADRLDRLRACGNGVVPLAAARAWIALNDLLADGARSGGIAAMTRGQ
jgi:DNA (cytosine-5)-methyltransferase 1